MQVPNDRWHSVAAEAMRDALARRVRLVTTNQVVGETYTLLRSTHGHPAAWRFVDTLDRSALLERIGVDAATERQAWETLRRYKDHAFSFVDGTSFAVMRARRIRHALAFDAHFAAAGFARVGVDGELP